MQATFASDIAAPDPSQRKTRRKIANRTAAVNISFWWTEMFSSGPWLDLKKPFGFFREKDRNAMKRRQLDASAKKGKDSQVV
jgi:hypothetical protein